MLNVALACGGTGGHIFPGLATAEVLVERGHRVVLWLAGKDLEAEAVRGWSGPAVTVAAEGFADGVSLRALRTLWRLGRAGLRCRRLMTADRPDVLLGMGSYASVPPVLASLMLGVPFVLHEANVLPGRAVRLFARRAGAVAGSFEETRYYLRRKDLVLTGLPTRRDLAAAAAAAADRARNGAGRPLTLPVMGGSRGARRLNEVATQAICECHQVGHRLAVIHLAGREDGDAVRGRYAAAGVPAVVHGFARDMGAIYPDAGLAISRCGASACAELAMFGVPALLVPYPHAANDHQTANARAMEKTGAADVVAEASLSVSWLKDYIAQCVQSPDRLARMSAAAASRALGRGAESLADLVEQVARARARGAPGARARD